MKPYHKINSVFMRDKKTHKFLSEFSYQEFACIGLWVAEEKLDGTNIRVHWDPEKQTVTFGGRTDNAAIASALLERLKQLFPVSKFDGFHNSTTLYGEGIGNKIQPGGSLYVEGTGLTHDFVLFDVTVSNGTKEFIVGVENVTEIALKLEVKRAPIIGLMSLEEAVERVKAGVPSVISAKPRDAEGLVLKTLKPLFNSRGDRIITKVKTVDFK